MIEGTASHTARSVAARRLEYERAPAPYGDPGADEALTRDVAAGLVPEHNRMHDYIRARTAFFDRVVVNSLDRGITQVVTGGAGYDGRAFRYAKPGVRWFEVDHPATQRDKRARIARLGLTPPRLSFIPADFTADPVAEALLSAGLDPDRPALFLFEGVAVYLDQPVIERVLAEFREVTPVGSPLAISVSIDGATSVSRARFKERVAALGEPYRTALTIDAAGGLLAAAGWKLRQPGDRQRAAGLLLAHAAIAQDHPERQHASQVPPPSAPAAPSAPGASASVASAPDVSARDVSALASAQVASAAVPSAPAPPAQGAQPADGELRRTAAGPRRPASVTSRQAERLPLSALLSQALVAFTIEADNETELRLPHRTSLQGRSPGAPAGAPWLTSLLMYANCLRHLPDAGLTVAELRARARTGTNLDGMRRWRYVIFVPEPAQGKRPKPGTLIRPTAWGIEARDTWQAVTAEVEARWRSRLGEEDFAALRAALTSLVANLDPALPDCLPVLGYGLAARRQDQADQARTRTSTAGDLPLWALLSRPLAAFAAQYEEEPGPSLAMSANILRVLTAGGVHTKDIPVLAGVSRESVAMAVGALRKSGLATEGPDPAGSRFKLTRLTPRGVAARDEYPALAADIEQDWRARFGDATVTAVRQALAPLAAGDPPRLFAGLSPRPGNWRAALPPPATLPHFPMTLHRGGYPDGS